MNADHETLYERLVRQLSAFERQLDSRAGDIDSLSDIQKGIGRLLSDGNASEADLRRVLQECYERGELRKETFQVVKSMLDKYVTEIIETSPSIAEAADLLHQGVFSADQPAANASPEEETLDAKAHNRSTWLLKFDPGLV